LTIWCPVAALEVSIAWGSTVHGCVERGGQEVSMTKCFLIVPGSACSSGRS